MNVMTIFKKLPIFALALLCVFSLCAKEAKPPKSKEKDKEKEKSEPAGDARLEWSERVVPGPAVQIRIKRAEGKFLIYEGSLERTQDSINSYVEKDQFYLNVLCAQQRDEVINGKNRTIDMMAIGRTFIDRHRTETLENGKTVKRELVNTEELISIGPNYELVGKLRCHGYDTQNCALYRTEQLVTLKDSRQLRGSTLTEDANKIVFLTAEEKLDIARADIVSIAAIPQPHVCLNEGPHYVFPVFSERKVSPGDTWKFKIPIIIPIDHGNPPRLLPTQFNVMYTGRLREVRSNVAIVDYQVHGAFDSTGEEFSTRFPDAFHQTAHIVHKFNGDGVVSVDLEKGRILEKSEVFNIMLFANSSVPVAADKPPQTHENKAQIVSRYQMKLMPSGSKLKNGAEIPPYE
jgi:hypothetical protein